jgi:hypothetical protein
MVISAILIFSRGINRLNSKFLGKVYSDDMQNIENTQLCDAFLNYFTGFNLPPITALPNFTLDGRSSVIYNLYESGRVM